MEFMPVRDLLVFASTCEGFRRLLQHVNVNVTAIARVSDADTGAKMLKLLPRLQALQVRWFTDITFLSRAVTIRHLNLHRTPVRDIAALASLVGLETLDLHFTPVSDITALASLV